MDMKILQTGGQTRAHIMQTLLDESTAKIPRYLTLLHQISDKV